MIALVAGILAVQHIQIEGVHRITGAERIYGRDIVFQCDVPLLGQPIAFVANLDGEITGDKGPLTLAQTSGTSITQFKSLVPNMTFDEKLPIGHRDLDVRLPNKLTIGGSKYLGELRFTYAQDGVFPNQVYRSDRVSAAKITLFNARDMKSGYGLYVPKSRAIRPVVETACRASSRMPLVNGSPR